MLTEFEVKSTKSQSKDYTINAESGLFLLVKSSGSKLWRYRYSFAGKRYLLSLGQYPTTTTKLAKEQNINFANAKNHIEEKYPQAYSEL